MSTSRTEILEWVERGRLPAEALPAVLRLARITPGPADWRRFLSRLTLWLGTVFCAAAVIFFFAYNWQAMGRYAKFGLAEGLIIAAVFLAWRLGLERAGGKAALLAAALLVGALLALVGQTYQTGADTYELFAVWALAILPWVAVSCFGALWLLWIGLINLAALAYFQAFGIWFGLVFGPEKQLWLLFALNTTALCVWEFAARRGVPWLREIWPVRILAVASGGALTALAVWAVLDSQRASIAHPLVYLTWMAAAYLAYRRWQLDLFVLAGAVLSIIIVVTTLLSNQLLKQSDGASFLFIGLVVIGLSALGGYWLKAVAREQRS